MEPAPNLLKQQSLSSVVQALKVAGHVAQSYVALQSPQSAAQTVQDSVAEQTPSPQVGQVPQSVLQLPQSSY